MNHFRTSDGTRVSKKDIDLMVHHAKGIKLRQQYDDLGYNVCETCKRNDDLPIDVAHIESVDSCQKNGRAEKAWDLDNMIIEGRKCHKKRDKTTIG